MATYTGFYITATVCMAIIVTVVTFVFCLFNIPVDADVKAVWLNIHASIVEVFLLGLFITKFNDFTKKQRDIKGWLDEIDYYRFWKEPEASYRNGGLIKRLNKAKITKIDLYTCHLEGAKLDDVVLIGSDIRGADLRNAILSRANLKGADFELADLSNSQLNWADLSTANLSGANIENANLYGANLSGTILCNTLVDENWFEKLKEWKCIGAGEIEKKYCIFSENLDFDTKYSLKVRVTQVDKNA